MKIQDLMTREVVSASPTTSLKDVAAKLAEHRISGLPVCDAKRKVLGVVTEADILWKVTGVKPGRGLLDRVFEVAYGDRGRVDALTAGDAMTTPAVTVGPAESVSRAAELMVGRHINRLPVVTDGRLVGIVARSDLVRAFVRSDVEIEREIRNDVLARILWIDADTLALTVVDGDVTVAGEVENHTTAELVDEYIRRVPGVMRVSADLRWQVDDRSRRTARALRS